MAEPIADASTHGEFTEALAFAVMRLWAAAMQIEQSFTRAEIHSLPDLVCAIEKVRCLPASVGWADPEPSDTES